jgi:UDP-glucose 4-epimerase
VNAIFAALQRATGSTVPPAHGAPRPGDVRNIWLDAKLASTALGWEPRVSLDEGLATTVAWYRRSH